MTVFENRASHCMEDGKDGIMWSFIICNFHRILLELSELLESRRISSRWEGHGVWRRRVEKCSLKRGDNLEDQAAEARILLRCIIKE
jgi:hypothetical protein